MDGQHEPPGARPGDWTSTWGREIFVTRRPCTVQVDGPQSEERNVIDVALALPHGRFDPRKEGPGPRGRHGQEERRRRARGERRQGNLSGLIYVSLTYLINVLLKKKRAFPENHFS